MPDVDQARPAAGRASAVPASCRDSAAASGGRRLGRAGPSRGPGRAGSPSGPCRPRRRGPGGRSSPRGDGTASAAGRAKLGDGRMTRRRPSVTGRTSCRAGSTSIGGGRARSRRSRRGTLRILPDLARVAFRPSTSSPARHGGRALGGVGPGEKPKSCPVRCRSSSLAVRRTTASGSSRRSISGGDHLPIGELVAQADGAVPGRSPPGCSGSGSLRARCCSRGPWPARAGSTISSASAFAQAARSLLDSESEVSKWVEPPSAPRRVPIRCAPLRPTRCGETRRPRAPGSRRGG